MDAITRLNNLIEVGLAGLSRDNRSNVVHDLKAVIRVVDKLNGRNTALLEACKELLELADDGSAAFDDPEPDSPYVKAKAAIQAAEGD